MRNWATEPHLLGVRYEPKMFKAGPISDDVLTERSSTIFSDHPSLEDLFFATTRCFLLKAGGLG